MGLDDRRAGTPRGRSQSDFDQDAVQRRVPAHETPVTHEFCGEADPLRDVLPQMRRAKARTP